MKRFFKKIKDFFKYDVRYGIRNFIIWRKVIWKDRNFDQYYIYAILKHKLTLMEECIRDSYVGSDKEADNIKLCVYLLDRLMKDVYFEMAFKKHFEKWGDIELEFKPIEGDDEYSEVLFNQKNVNTKEEKEKSRIDFKRACDHENYLRDQDLDMLFTIMRKHIRGWWN